MYLFRLLTVSSMLCSDNERKCHVIQYVTNLSEDLYRLRDCRSVMTKQLISTFDFLVITTLRRDQKFSWQQHSRTEAEITSNKEQGT